MKTAICPVCGMVADSFDVVDFNKSCDPVNSTGAPLSGVPIYYYRCSDCGFLFAPEIYGWTLEEFSQKIYNSQYIEIDPDYVELRPRQNAEFLESRLGSVKGRLKHLDFGGGNGSLCQTLSKCGWNTISYDPFSSPNQVLPSEKYDLVTAFEVIEHAPDINAFMKTMRELLSESGVLLLTTSLSDEHVVPGSRLTWWYASPRNGHISIFSSASLERLFSNYGLRGVVSKTSLQIAYRQKTDWIELLLPPKGFKSYVRDVLALYPPALSAARAALKVLRRNK